MNQQTIDLLKRLGKKYIWWKTPEEALLFPRRLMAQAMNLATEDEIQELLDRVGEDAFRDVIRNAEAGWFFERRWYYWHHQLGLARNEPVPPLPVRKFPWHRQT